MVTIFVVAEDALASGVSRHLLDRIVPDVVRVEWLRDLWTDQLVAAREYVPLEPNYLQRIPPGLEGKAKDVYRAWRAAIVETERRGLNATSTALLLAFDSDHNEAHLRLRRGVEAVRTIAPTRALDASLGVICAEATPEFDAWVMLGHEPTEHERTTLNEVRALLGFDPRERPEALNSTTGNERDAKRLCTRLLHLDGPAHPSLPRVIDALNAQLSTFRERGTKVGIAEFANDVEAVLRPILGDRMDH